MTEPQPHLAGGVPAGSFNEAAPPRSLADQLAGPPPDTAVEEKSYAKGAVKPGGKHDGRLKAGGNSRNRGKKH